MSVFESNEIGLLSDADLEKVNGGAVPSPAILFAREVRNAVSDAASNAASSIAAADYALGLAVSYLTS